MEAVNGFPGQIGNVSSPVDRAQILEALEFGAGKPETYHFCSAQELSHEAIRACFAVSPTSGGDARMCKRSALPSEPRESFFAATGSSSIVRSIAIQFSCLDAAPALRTTRKLVITE